MAVHPAVQVRFLALPRTLPLVSGCLPNPGHLRGLPERGQAPRAAKKVEVGVSADGRRALRPRHTALTLDRLMQPSCWPRRLIGLQERRRGALRPPPGNTRYGECLSAHPSHPRPGVWVGGTSLVLLAHQLAGPANSLHFHRRDKSTLRKRRITPGAGQLQAAVTHATGPF